MVEMQRQKVSFLTPPPPTEAAEGQLSAEEEEARRIAEMGKPILGEHSRVEVVIEESYEFKVLQCLLRTNICFTFSSWSCKLRMLLTLLQAGSHWAQVYYKQIKQMFCLLTWK